MPVAVHQLRSQRIRVITVKEDGDMVQAVHVLVVSADSAVVSWARQALANLPQVEVRDASSLGEMNEAGSEWVLIDPCLIVGQSSSRSHSPWLLLSGVGQAPPSASATGAVDVIAMDAMGADRLVQYVGNTLSPISRSEIGYTGTGGLDVKMMDTLFSQFAHDFRGPLNSLTMWSSLLRSDETLPKSVAPALDAFAASIATQTELVEELLDFGRILSGRENRLQPEWIDWPFLVASVQQHLMLFAVRKAINLDLVVGHVKQVYAERVQLERIFTTLLLHCIQKSVSGSTISLIDRLEDNQLMLQIVSSKVNSPLTSTSIPTMSGSSSQVGTTNRRPQRDRRLVLAEQLIIQIGGSLTEHLVSEDGQYQVLVRLPAPQTDE